MSLSAVERLQSLGIYPLVFLIKFKSPKQIREVKDTRLTEKLSAKVAKEVFEHGGKIEAEFKPLISGMEIRHLSHSKDLNIPIYCLFGGMKDFMWFLQLSPQSAQCPFHCEI